MKAIEFTPEQGFQLTDKTSVTPEPGEVLLNVDACGVCGSDRQIVNGGPPPKGTTFPLIMGHEIAGTIAAVGDQVEGWQVHDSVLVHPFIPCGTCSACQNQQYNLCLRQTCIGYHRQGGFAEQMVVPAQQLIRGSHQLSALALALLPDAFATPYHAIRLTEMTADDTVLVIGTGGLGLATLQLASIFAPKRLGAVTRRSSGVETAQNYGAEMAVALNKQHRATARQIRRWSGSSGVDVIIDTVGTSASMTLALDVIKPGGTITLVGLSDESVPLPILKTVQRGIKVIGSFGSLPEDISMLRQLAEKKQFDPSSLVAGTLPLEHIHQAFTTDRQSGRWVIEPNR
ncbi:zinc-dependent alcohol dehydrogenase [Tuberibacillus sp. Marseille-P3662]|uniref:zinc-dependent alcohol dehydrogenase n=1 Tax=Tuberibacillus sp. Marseille-P3662 TaxID=1965358 RepID=UPI0015936110|nr:alcohol dehydrogenase catalytic domain-containing protein [Tuberibacillus sp. Marseille-P3662]